MNKNNKYIKTAIFAAVLSLCFILPICSVFAGGKQEPRVEIITQKDSFGNERKKEIRFVDSNGKITKKLPAKGLIVNAKRNYVLQNVEPKTKPPKNRNDFFYFSKSLLNVDGKEKWNKTYKTFPASFDHDVEHFDIDYGISDSVGTVFINYRDSLGQYHIEIIDSTGSTIDSLINNFWFDEILIAPDATTLVTHTYNEKNKELIIVVDIDTKNKKTFRSKGVDWSITVHPKDNHKIYLIGHLKEDRIWLIVNYNELSEDISQLIYQSQY